MKFDFADLIEKGLVKEKRYPNGLRVLKYSRKVFYDALWNEDKRLLDARGLVLDAEGNAVIWPFTKVFNYQENGTDCASGCLVDVVEKINGFMAAVALYKGELLVSTTGTLDSDFVTLARKHVEQLNWDALWAESELFQLPFTFIFEICDPDDPHIVPQASGAYLIGIRRNWDGAMATEGQLDGVANILESKRPTYDQMLFEQVLGLIKECRHEGFMIRDAWTGETLMKIKSPHYLTKKFLMRMGDGKVDNMFDNFSEFRKTLDEEFYEVAGHIVTSYSKENWKELTDQQRREIIEEYFNG